MTPDKNKIYNDSRIKRKIKNRKQKNKLKQMKRKYKKTKDRKN